MRANRHGKAWNRKGALSRRTAWLAALVGVASCAPALRAVAETVISVGGYIAPDGQLIRNAYLVIDHGVIKQISTERPANVDEGALVDRSAAIVCPGLFDLRAGLSAFGAADETVGAVEPGASVEAAVDPRHRDWSSALESGITSALIMPGVADLIGGTGVVVKTTGPDGPKVVRRGEMLSISLGPEILLPDRPPTSLSGAAALLRETLRQARTLPPDDPLSRLIGGKLRCVCYCPDLESVAAMVNVMDTFGLAGAIVHTQRSADIVPFVSKAKIPVIVGPFSFDSAPRTIMGANLIAESGAPLAFAADMPRGAGDALRITAAMAVRSGLSPAVARRAMTIVPAEIAGVAGLVGSLEPGKQADLVVLSGDPLDLSSRVLEVYIEGVRVYRWRELCPASQTPGERAVSASR